MSEKKRKINPWVPVVVMGVVAILFSVYAFQSQSDLLDAKKEMEQLKNQVTECGKAAKEQQAMSVEARRMAREDADIMRVALEDCKKTNKRK